MKEIWRDIEGYEGMYQVSDLGRVQSLDRKDSKGRMIKGKILSLSGERIENYRVRLNRNGKVRSFYVRDLVSYAFISHPTKEEIERSNEKSKMVRYGVLTGLTETPTNDRTTGNKQDHRVTCAYQERLIEQFEELAARCHNIEGRSNEIHCKNAYVKGSVSTHVLPDKVWGSSQPLIDKFERIIPERFIVADGGIARPLEDLQDMVKKARQDGVPRNLYELFAKYTTEQERLFQVYVPIMLIDMSFAWLDNMAGYIKEKRLPFHKWLRPLAQHREEYEIAIKLAIGVSMFHSLKRRTAELGISIHSDITKMLYCIDNAIMKTSPLSSHHLAMSFAEVALILIELAREIDLDFEKIVSERSGIIYKGKESCRIERIKELLHEIVRELCGKDEFNPIDLNNFPIIKSACQAIKNRLQELEFAF